MSCTSFTTLSDVRSALVKNVQKAKILVQQQQQQELQQQNEIE